MALQPLARFGLALRLARHAPPSQRLLHLAVARRRPESSAVASAPPQSETHTATTPSDTFQNYHYTGMPVTPAAVQQGLQLQNADKCPFLAEVKSVLSESPEAVMAIQRGGDTATTKMKSVIGDCLVNVLDRLKQEDRYRTFRYLKRTVGEHPEVVWQRPPGKEDPSGVPVAQVVVNWCSNDYLNMGHHPNVLAAMEQTLRDQGAGAGGTRNISGSNILHVELEKELADLSGTPAALLFQSCYAANLGVMEALTTSLGSDTIIFSDEENHASLVQGIRNTRLPKRIFHHNDVDHLRLLLEEAPANAKKVVVFESVYSMSGSRAPVNAILDLCEEFQAVSILDEVHAVGLYGPQGGGILDELNMRGRADLITGTLGKAFGVGGGFVAGSAHWVDVIRSTAPSFIFTTSMSPVIAAGALASVRAVRAEADARAKMHATTAQLKRRLLQAGVPLMSVETHIMPVHVGNGALCKAMADELLQRGIYVQPINYPSVPKGGDLLRFTASPKHTQEHCDAMVENLVDLCRRHGLLVAPSDCAFVEMPSLASTEDVRNYGMNQAVWCSEGSNCCVLRRMAA